MAQAQQEAPGYAGGGSPETPCPLQWVLGQGVQSVLMGVADWSQENPSPGPVFVSL